MTWVRLDDEFTQHPKVVSAGPLAIAMQVAALCYCNRNLTDGKIPWAVARSLLAWEFLAGSGQVQRVAVTSGASGNDVTCEYVIGLLLDAGIWEEVPGGYVIHDFGDYQPSKEEVLRLREQRQAAGRAGGLAKAKASATAKPLADAKQNPSKAPSKTPSKTLAKSYPVPVPVPVPGSVSDPNNAAAATNNAEDSALEVSPSSRKEAQYDVARSVAFELYEQSIGTITPYMAEVLAAASDEYPEDCLGHAFEEAVRQNVRKWAYVEAILKSHAEKGCYGEAVVDPETDWLARRYQQRKEARE